MSMWRVDSGVLVRCGYLNKEIKNHLRFFFYTAKIDFHSFDKMVCGIIDS